MRYEEQGKRGDSFVERHVCTPKFVASEPVPLGLAGQTSSSQSKLVLPSLGEVIIPVFSAVKSAESCVAFAHF